MKDVPLIIAGAIVVTSICAIRLLLMAHEDPENAVRISRWGAGMIIALSITSFVLGMGVQSLTGWIPVEATLVTPE